MAFVEAVGAEFAGATGGGYPFYAGAVADLPEGLDCGGEVVLVDESRVGGLYVEGG